VDRGAYLGDVSAATLSSLHDPDFAEPSPGTYAVSERERMLYIEHTETCLRRRLRNHHVICLDEKRIGHPATLMLDPADVVRFSCCGDAERLHDSSNAQ
jgi:hypothetical protein